MVYLLTSLPRYRVSSSLSNIGIIFMDSPGREQSLDRVIFLHIFMRRSRLNDVRASITIVNIRKIIQNVLEYRSIQIIFWE